jgi:hypothetical protein
VYLQGFVDSHAEDGWRTLCPFLGVETPAVPFPRVNDTKEMQGRARFVKPVFYAIPVVVSALLLLSIRGLIYLF